jgi:hypothetical protein
MTKIEPVAWINYLDGRPYELSFKSLTESNSFWAEQNPIAECLSCGPLFTADQLAQAVVEERERCARICEELYEHYSAVKDTALLNGDIELSNAASGEPRACLVIATAIRRGQ